MATAAATQKVSAILAAADADPMLDEWEIGFVIDATNQKWDPLAIANFIKRRRDMNLMEKAIAYLDEGDKAVARELYLNRGMSIESVLRFIGSCHERKKRVAGAKSGNDAAGPPNGYGT